MKTASILMATLAMAGLAYAGPADEVTAAAKKLAEKGAYAWKSTVDTGAGGGGGGRGGMRGGPTEGSIAKDGVAMLKMTRGDNVWEVVMKDGKGVMKTAEGWEAVEAGGGGGTGSGGGPNPGRMMGRMVQNFKAPAVEAQELVGKVKELKMADGVYSGALTVEGAKSLLTMGWRPAGGNAPEPANPSGTVKFWIKDGVLTKYEHQVQGTFTFNGQERDVNRTTTVEIRDAAGASIPEEARKKLS